MYDIGSWMAPRSWYQNLPTVKEQRRAFIINKCKKGKRRGY